MDSIQYELYETTLEQQFRTWKDTETGREILNRFIRVAIGMKRRGFTRYSARAIVYRLRFHYDLQTWKQNQGHSRSKYKINNNWTPYIARFSEQRIPELKDFFTKKTVGKHRRSTSAVVVPIKAAASCP